MVFPGFKVDRIAAKVMLAEKGAQRGKEEEPNFMAADFRRGREPLLFG